MCWPCCWPCLVVDDPPARSAHSPGEKAAPPVSRRRAIGEIAATKGFAPVSRRPSRRPTRRVDSSRTMAGRLRPVIAAEMPRPRPPPTRRPETPESDPDDENYRSVSHGSSVGRGPGTPIVPRAAVPDDSGDAPDDWLTPSMVSAASVRLYPAS